MPKPVRDYHSPSRKERAQTTRRAIIDSARKLLSEQGYQATTMEQIAREAGCATPTVYAGFASKQGILSALKEEASFDIGYQERVEKTLAATDPREKLRGAASIATAIYVSEREVMEFLRGAGVVSPELALKEKEREEQRYERQAALIDSLQSHGHLRQGLQHKKARDLLWTLTSRDIFRSLVLVQSWKVEEYQDWLGATLIEQLLQG